MIWISLEGYQIIFVRSFSFAKGQQAFESINLSAVLRPPDSHRNVLEKHRRGEFKRIRKTLFVTVAMNQVKLVSVIFFEFPLSCLSHVQNE